MLALAGVLVGVVYHQQALKGVHLHFRALDGHEGRVEQDMRHDVGRIRRERHGPCRQRDHAFGQGVRLDDKAAGDNFHDLEGLEVGEFAHLERDGVGPALDAGKVHRVGEVARMEVAQELGRAAQAHGKLVGKPFAHHKAAGKPAIFHAKFHLRFHMVAADHQIPEPRCDNEGEQSRKQGLPAGITG